MTEDIIFTPYPDTGILGTAKDIARYLWSQKRHLIERRHIVRDKFLWAGLEILCFLVGHKTTAKQMPDGSAGFICKRCDALFGAIQFKPYSGPEIVGPGELFSQTMAQVAVEREKMRIQK